MSQKSHDITEGAYSGSVAKKDIDYSDDERYYTIYNFDSKYYFSVPVAYKGKTASLGTDNIIVQFNPEMYLSIKGNDYFGELEAEERLYPREEYTLGSASLNDTFNDLSFVTEYMNDKASVYSDSMELRSVSKEKINDAIFWVFSYTDKTSISDENHTGSEIRFYLNLTDGYIYFLMINSLDEYVNNYPDIVETVYSFHIGYHTDTSAYYFWAAFALISLLIIFATYEAVTKVTLICYDDAGNKIRIRASRRYLKRIGRINAEYESEKPTSPVLLSDEALKACGISETEESLATEETTPESKEPTAKDETTLNKETAEDSAETEPAQSREKLLAELMAMPEEHNSITAITRREVNKIGRNAEKAYNNPKALEELDRRVEKIDREAELKAWAYANMPKEYTFKLKASEIAEEKNEITAILSVADYLDPSEVLKNYSGMADIDTLIETGEVIDEKEKKLKAATKKKSEQRKKDIRESKRRENKNAAKPTKDEKAETVNFGAILDEILVRTTKPNASPKPKKDTEKPAGKRKSRSTKNKTNNTKQPVNKDKGTEENNSSNTNENDIADILDSILGRNS